MNSKICFSRKEQRGFTLVEMVISVGVITIIMSTMLLNRGQYNDRLVLKNQTYILASYIRQAQSHSLAVRSNAGNFNVGYGVSLNEDLPESFIFFSDNNGDGKHSSSETIQTINFTDKVRINNLCGTSGAGPHCLSSIRKIDITFKRPNPTAVIKILNPGEQEVSSIPAQIQLRSGIGTIMTLMVDSTGQVSIQ